MQRVLAIWLPNWPLQRLLSARPELRGQPVILEAPSRRGQAVAACSPEAQAAGVEVGMPTAEAITILAYAQNPNPAHTPTRTRISPPFSLLPYDPAADRKALARLAQWCHRYSPTAGFEEADAPETLLLDAANLAPLYGSEELFARQVAQGLRRLGLEARIALAATIGAAWALAHYAAMEGETIREGKSAGEGEAPAEPLLISSGSLPLVGRAREGGDLGTRFPSLPVPASRLGGSLALPLIVPDEQTHAALAPLPIAALRLEAGLLETLANLGAERIGDLLSLPREQLRSRFGPQLLKRIDQALGAAREVFVAVDPPQDFIVEQLFEYPVSQRESLHHAVETLLGRLAWMLAARSAGALRVACRFDCEGAPPTEIEVGLFQPTASSRHLLEIVELELERLRLHSPAIAVTVRALRHAPLAERQQVLFDQERSLDGSRRLAALVDRLSSCLGEAAVLRCRLQPDAQPERAYKHEPLVGGRESKGKSRGLNKLSPPALGSRPSALDRPLYLLRPPAPLEAIALVPDGPPIQFRRAGRRHTVARHWGPERIETGWWRGQSAWRDYYRVETTEGLRYWLYRRRHDGRWFLHGMFG